jgi:hypothetical protein
MRKSYKLKMLYMKGTVPCMLLMVSLHANMSPCRADSTALIWF